MIMSWQWLGGFFEGEGHIQFVQGKKGTKQGTSGRIVIGQNYKPVLSAIKLFLEEQGCEHVLFSKRPARLPKQPNPLWVLSIYERENVIFFLDKIYLYLFEKQEKAIEVKQKLIKLNKERQNKLQKALQLRLKHKSWREICRELHISAQTLYNYARSQGIELKNEYKADQISWRQDRLKRGLCGTCGKQRSENGTKQECKQCADKTNERTRIWKREWRKKKKLLSKM